jgi:aldose 1-epimerase
VTLTAGAARADIVGGNLLTVSSLRYETVELLADPVQLPSSYRVHGRRAGITLLHPWANRLGADAFAFRGVHGRLDGSSARVTRDVHGLAIHGLTAPYPWHPVRDGASAALASLTWPEEPGFPFAHQVAVRLELSSGPDASLTLAIETTVTPVTGDCVPIAFGWHPYFRHEGAAEIELPQLSVLDVDERGLPTGHEVLQERSRVRLCDRGFDYGGSGLSSGSQMRLHNGSRTITVEFGEGYTYGQVFAPSDAPVVSLEPMTAPTDALRRGTRLPVAGPERPYVASFVVRLSDSLPRT